MGGDNAKIWRYCSFCAVIFQEELIAAPSSVSTCFVFLVPTYT